MSHKKALYILFGILTVICCGFAYFGFVPRVTVSEMQDRIDTALPLGSPWSEDEFWLKREGIFDGYIGKSKSKKPIGMSGHVIAGGRWNLLPLYITIEFYFDDKDRLTERIVYGYH